MPEPAENPKVERARRMLKETPPWMIDMPRPKRNIGGLADLLIMLALLSRKAHLEPVLLKTDEVGEIIGLSQQAASRTLVRMEAEGMIARHHGRTKFCISITAQGVQSLRELAEEIQAGLQKK